MLTIRLTRKGKKNQPFFKVVLVDKRKSSTGGRSIEDLGYVDPLKKRRSLKAERIKYWLSKGAQASATIHNLLVTEKIIDAKKIVKKSKKKPAEAVVATSTPAASAPAAKVEEKPVEVKAEAKPAEPAPAPVETPKEETKPVEEAKPEEKPAE